MCSIFNTGLPLIGLIFILYLTYPPVVDSRELLEGNVKMNYAGNCVLPDYLKKSKWNDTKTNTLLTFGTTVMTGWDLSIQGDEMKDFTCIANSGNVFLFRSDSQFYDFRDGNKRVYLCMKITNVTENLFYFYILSDTHTDINPPQKLYIPKTDSGEYNQICSFCNYTEPPMDSEYHLLQRENTKEALLTTPRVCLPCDASSCQFEETETKDKHKRPPMTIIFVIIAGVMVVLLLIVILSLVLRRRRHAQGYKASDTKDTEMEHYKSDGN